MKSHNLTDLNAIASSVFDDVYHAFSNQKEYCIVGHSFGSLVTLKIASMLEKMGKFGRVILIDGSPEYLFRLSEGLHRSVQTGNHENNLFMILYTHFCSSESLGDFVKTLQACDTLLSKINLLSQYVSTEFKTNYSKQYLNNITVAILNRLKIIMRMSENTEAMFGVMDTKLKSSITLIRPTQASFTDIVEDYDLRNYSEQDVTIKYVEGHHLSVLENTDLTNILNEVVSQQASKS